MKMDQIDYGTPPSKSEQMVSLTIDGQSVTVPKGTSVIRAAAEAGIDIPKLCATDSLDAFGSCRMCVVEVEGKRGYPAACHLPVEADMVVHTETPKVAKLRKGVLELYLSDYPMDALQSAQGEETFELEQVVNKVGVEHVRYGFDGKNHQDAEPDESNPYFVFDQSKCIVCNRCVRACEETQGTFALTIEGRGFDSKVSASMDESFLESECVSCGACVDACPTTALNEKSVMEDGAPDHSVETTCAYCGVGCSFEAELKGDKVVRMTPSKDGGANHGHSCVKGRFAWGYTNHPDRITSPMIREDNRDPWREVTWEEAFAFAAERMKKIQAEHGSTALGAITSSRCTNEETYLMQKLARAGFGTNNVDTCARVCHSPTGYGLKTTFGTSAGTQHFDSVDEADLIFVIGANPTDAHPVFASQMKRAIRNGARLIVADPRRIDLVRTPHVEAETHLQLQPGTNVALINGLAHAVVSEGLVDEEFVNERCDKEEFETWREFVMREENSPESVADYTGVPAELIRKAARAYATAGNSAIYYGLGVTEHSQGSTMVMGMANLAMATGNLGRMGVGVNPLRGQNNVQGSCDMGSFPHEYPGYRHVSDDQTRTIYEKEWGVELPHDPGLRIPNMIDAAMEGTFKGIYIQGEDILQSDPNIQHIAAGLSAMDCVIVQDLFLNETAGYAHVFFPGSTFLEKNGTFTNTERRINRVRKAVEPANGLEDWEITQRFANELGYAMNYSHPSEIMAEVARTTPSFAGVSYELLDEVGSVQWPCNENAPKGTPVMHIGKFVRGEGRFMLTPYVHTEERSNSRYPLLLTTGRILSQYNVGAQTRRTANSVWHKEDVLEIHPHDAEDRGINDGDLVAIASRIGQTSLRAQVSERMPQGVVYTTFHFPETAANVVTTEESDWATNCPEYKVTAVQVSLCNTVTEWQKRYMQWREETTRREPAEAEPDE